MANADLSDPGPASTASGVAPGRARSAATSGTRDPRLDFFRGLAMFIILVAHIPGNFLTLWIPARFGFSDATEIFVFCSGMASAIAFGGTFARQGWWMGTARTAFRVWQVYWAHIGTFLVTLAMLSAIDAAGTFGRSYVASQNLQWFLNDTGQNLIGLLTLTYVPNYFDILPMYLVILALMPVFIALGGASRPAAAAMVVVLWLGANLGLLRLPAEPWSDRPWFFNPFGWQLIFFTGFALMRGWLPPPPVNRRLVRVAAAVLLISLPFAYFRIYNAVPLLGDVRAAIQPLYGKSDFGILRYVHFLALAYLAWAAVGPGGARLMPSGSGVLSRAWEAVLAAILKVGQQSLAVFVFSMVAAQGLGFLMNLAGRSYLTMTLGNLLGFAALIAVAYTVAWFKGQPWRSKRAPTTAGTPARPSPAP